MTIYSPDTIEEIVQQFEAHTLPKEQWTHHAHLIVGLWYGWHWDYPQALERMREGIISYNEAVGTPNTDSSGYHETITQYWLKVIYRFCQEKPYTSVAEACNHLLASTLTKKYSLLSYYHKETLFSPHARKAWVEPDKHPFPFEGRVKKK